MDEIIIENLTSSSDSDSESPKYTIVRGLIQKPTANGSLRFSQSPPNSMRRSNSQMDYSKEMTYGIERKPVFCQNPTVESRKFTHIASRSLITKENNCQMASQEEKCTYGLDRKPIFEEPVGLYISPRSPLNSYGHDTPSQSFSSQEIRLQSGESVFVTGMARSEESSSPKFIADVNLPTRSNETKNVENLMEVFEAMVAPQSKMSRSCSKMEDLSQLGDFNQQSSVALSLVQPALYNSLGKQSTPPIPSQMQEAKALQTDAQCTDKPSKMRSLFPVTKEELAITITKVKLLESWMQNSSTKSPLVLLLSGPTGCGKTTAVQAIAASLNIRVTEWVTPMDDFHDFNQSGFPKASQSGKFTEFLLAGSRYQPLFGPASAKQVILVEDYPNAFLRTPSTFHDCVMKYREQGKCPLIFITTDGRKKIALDLFPEKLVKDARIDQISFNAVSMTSMVKAVDRLAALHNRTDVDVQTRKEICVAAQGDVRNAENIWNFRFGGGSRPAIGGQKARRRVTRESRKTRGSTQDRASKKSRLEGVSQIDSKDPAHEKLHSVGRVLYAKRESAPVEHGSRDTDQRGYLRSNPDTIVGQFLSERRSFLGLVHENYPAIFSHIDHAAAAADCLSLSDVIGADHLLDVEQLQEMSFSLAVRGFMTSCTKPITRWYPLKKSRTREMADASEKFHQYVRDRYAGSTFSLTVAKLDVVPLLARVGRSCSFERTPNTANTAKTGPETGSDSPTPHISDDSDEDYAPAAVMAKTDQ